MTTVQLPPFDLRVVYPWMQLDAIFAAHFKQGQYWLDDAKGPIAASSLLTTTRSSGINLPNAAGVFQAHGNNTLPRTDRGLYVNGQITNLLGRSNPTVAQIPSVTNIVDGPGFAGFPHSIYYGGGMGGSDSRYLRTENNAVNGQPYTASVLAQMLDGNPPVFGSATPNNAANTFFLHVGSNSASPPDYIVEQVGADIWKVIAKGTFVVDGGVYGVYQGSNNQPRAFNLCGLQCFIGDVSPAAIVPGIGETGGPTLLASDIRAVQGVRPSNAQSEPFPGWEAAGLDSAFGGKNIVAIDRLNAAEPRFITGAGVDANNLTKMIFDTDNRFKLIVRKSGVDEVTLQTGAVAATGDKTIEWQAKPGDYAIAATGVAGDTDSDGATLPAGATTLRVGSDFGVLNPFNGWISELQIARAA